MIKTPSPRHFDPIAFYARARKLARAMAPDAELTFLRAFDVRMDGTVNLSRSSSVEYQFISDARAQDPERWCLVMVVVHAKSATASLARPSDSCTSYAKHVPRCKLVEIMERARAKGAPADGSFMVNFLDSWGVSAGKFGVRIEDDC